MHGYDPNLDDSCGMAILAGTEINKIQIPLLELHKLNMILKDSLEIMDNILITGGGLSAHIWPSIAQKII